jgi:hypothetical protein
MEETMKDRPCDEDDGDVEYIQNLVLEIPWKTFSWKTKAETVWMELADDHS